MEKMISFLLLLFFQGNDACVCLKVDYQEDSLQLKCSVPDLEYGVMFLDPYQKIHGFCDTLSKKSSANCTNNVYQDTTTNIVTLVLPYISERYRYGIGKWTCIYGNNEGSDYVVVQSKLMPKCTTDFKGDVIEVNGKYTFSFSCQTCLSPVGNAVEFLVNDVTVDVIKDINGKCYNVNGECNNKCSCSAVQNIYKWSYQTHNSSNRSFGVQMRFIHENGSLYKTYNTLNLNGSDLLPSKSESVVIGTVKSVVNGSSKDDTAKKLYFPTDVDVKCFTGAAYLIGFVFGFLAMIVIVCIPFHNLYWNCRYQYSRMLRTTKGTKICKASKNMLCRNSKENGAKGRYVKDPTHSRDYRDCFTEIEFNNAFLEPRSIFEDSCDIEYNNKTEIDNEISEIEYKSMGDTEDLNEKVRRKNERVYTLQQLKPGDAIGFKRKEYMHHAVVSTIVNKKRFQIFHLTSSFNVSVISLRSGSRATVSETALDFSKSSEMYKYEYAAERKDGIHPVTVARTIFTHGLPQDYNILDLNSEHFASYCVTGILYSNQTIRENNFAGELLDDLIQKHSSFQQYSSACVNTEPM